MSEEKKEEFKKKLTDLLKQYSEGLSFHEIVQKTRCKWPERTIHRYLKIFIEEGLLQIIGRGRATKYQYLGEDKQRIESLAKSLELQGVPLSSKAQHQYYQITKPIQTRKHVGYCTEFLDNYQPNRTCYLSDKERNHLFKIGASPVLEYPAGTYAKKIFHRLLIDLAWNSSRLEGNTYSLLDTQKLIEYGEINQHKDAKDAQMIINHKAAIEFLVESVDAVKISRHVILNLHALLSHNLLPNPKACGSLRTIAVHIGGTLYQPIEIPQLLNDCFEEMIHKGALIQDPFEQALFLMIHLPYLQPFEDVNKRVSRIAANIPLIKSNLCPLSFAEVPVELYINSLLVIYEKQQIELLKEIFIWAYERSSALYQTTRQTLGEPDPFRFKYQTLIAQVIQNIVTKKLKSEKLTMVLREQAGQIPKELRQKFIEIVQEELEALHEGNIARYRITIEQFLQWKAF